MVDHAPYIHAVAAHLGKAGFHVLSVGGHDWEPRGGHIWLGCQDGWDHYDRGDADLRWDETAGWTITWGGLTDPLFAPRVASPSSVAFAVGAVVGQTPTACSDRFADVRAEPGTPEFDAALAAYDTERTPR